MCEWRFRICHSDVWSVWGFFLVFFNPPPSAKVFILSPSSSSSLACHCKQLNMPLSYSIRLFCFLSFFLQPNDSCHGAELNIKALTDPQCNRAFISQLSNPRSSLSPLFGEWAPKAKSLSQFTRWPGHHYFVHTAMIIIIKACPLHNHHNHKDAISLAGKKDINTSCVHNAGAHTQGLIYLCFHIFIYFLHFGKKWWFKGTDAR